MHLLKADTNTSFDLPSQLNARSFHAFHLLQQWWKCSLVSITGMSKSSSLTSSCREQLLNSCSAVSCIEGELHFSLTQVSFHFSLTGATHSSAGTLWGLLHWLRWLMRSYVSEPPKGSFKEEGNRKSLSGSVRREQALLQGKITVLVHAPALFAEALPGCLLFQAGGTDPCWCHVQRNPAISCVTRPFLPPCSADMADLQIWAFTSWITRFSWLIMNLLRLTTYSQRGQW